MVVAPAQAAGDCDSAVGGGASGGAFQYPPTAVAERLAGLAGAGGEVVPCVAVCPDAGIAAAGLGDDFGGGGSGDAEQFAAVAGDHVGQSDDLCLFAQGPWVPGVSVVPDGIGAPGGGAVSWLDSSGWGVGKHGARQGLKAVRHDRNL